MIDRISSAGAGLSARARLARLPLALAGACSVLCTLPAFAQGLAAAPALRETVVTANRVEQPLSDLVADVSIVERAEIERSGVTGVIDVLARLPGIEVSRNGGIGNTSSVFIRGAESRFTAVYIDGVRIDSQSTGGANWEAIPLAQIDRIEVLRGPAAAVYGSDAIGGVIQLFTRKGEGGIAPYVGVGIGSRNTRKIEAGVSGSAGAFDYSLGAAREKSDGFNVRLDRGYNPDRDDYNSSSGNARLGFQIDRNHRIDATLLASNVDSGYDNTNVGAAARADDRSKYRLRTAGLSWSAQWTDFWRTRLSVSDSVTKYMTVPAFYATETELRSYLFHNEFRFGPHVLTAALERREDHLKNAPDAFSRGLDRERSQNGLALGYGLVQGAHTLQLNVRHDDDSEFGGQNTGSAAYGFAITPAWRVTASAGTSFRAPTLYQRFSQYGVAGLEPEEGRNVELGLRYAQGATSASATVYRNRVRNLIAFDFASFACAGGAAFGGCYGNTARASYEGVTFAASHRLGDVTLRGSLDFQDPRDDITDRQLVNRSRRHATLGADWRVGTWTLGAEVQASGERFANAANTQRLHGYGLLNLSASAPITPEISVVARLDNAADREYQLVRNYATPGRTAYLGLKWTPKL